MPPPTPKKPKSTEAKTSDPEPMKGLTPPRPGYVTPKSTKPGDTSPDYSPAQEVDLGESVSSAQKAEMARIGSRQEEFQKAMNMEKLPPNGGRKSRKHKKSKKSRKTRKVKKHGKRRH